MCSAYSHYWWRTHHSKHKIQDMDWWEVPIQETTLTQTVQYSNPGLDLCGMVLVTNILGGREMCNFKFFSEVCNRLIKVVLYVYHSCSNIWNESVYYFKHKMMILYRINKGGDDYSVVDFLFHYFTDGWIFSIVYDRIDFLRSVSIPSFMVRSLIGALLITYFDVMIFHHLEQKAECAAKFKLENDVTYDYYNCELLPFATRTFVTLKLIVIVRFFSCKAHFTSVFI